MTFFPCRAAIACLLAWPLAVASPVMAAGAACPKPAAWTSLEGERPQPIAGGALLAAMAQRDVVLLGERHDDEDHHRWQLQTLAALHATRPNMTIGFEMFPRSAQAVLDRWVAGELSVREFLEKSRWDEVWNMPAELYLPLFQFARINRIPMLALNIDRKLTEAIAEKGWDGVPPAEREGVGRPAAAPAAYRDFLFEIWQDHPSRHDSKAASPKRDDPDFLRFVDAQLAWDRAMAEALARPLAGTGERPLLVGVMGSGHIRHGHGVPHQLRDLGVTRIGTLLPVSGEDECKDIRNGLAHAVFAVPDAARSHPPPPRLGVQLEAHEGGIRIAAVTAGSLAEKTDLRAGDRIVLAAGSRVDKVAKLVGLVRRTPAGAWLPLTIRRGTQTLETLVKFPPEP
jgi:uncharacterized iron-regulated protein